MAALEGRSSAPRRCLGPLLLVAALTLAGSSASGQTPSGPPERRWFWDDGARLTTPNLKLKIGGQGQLDTAGFAGEDVVPMQARAFRRLRPRIQMVFQEPYDSLSPRMRVGRQVAEPLRMLRELSAAERSARVVQALDMVRLGAGAMERYPHQFSAGEQQRIGIARALVTQPDLVVLDEPTSALDVSVRSEVLDLLADLQQRLGLAYLFISHDLTAVRRVCDRVAIMYLGKIVETGDTEQIFEAPLHPYSRALLSSVLYPDPRHTLSRFVLRGEIPSPIDLPAGCHLYQRCPWAEASCAEAYPPMEAFAPGREVACYRAGAIRAEA